MVRSIGCMLVECMFVGYCNYLIPLIVYLVTILLNCVGTSYANIIYGKGGSKW